MTSRVCNDISVGQGHQLLMITLIDELLSQVKILFFRVSESVVSLLGLASATFTCGLLHWEHMYIAVVTSDNPHLQPWAFHSINLTL